eukprot:scaffold7095_cov260-Pinguiococcus_pyrenoidosus.AAC.26
MKKTPAGPEEVENHCCLAFLFTLRHQMFSRAQYPTSATFEPPFCLLWSWRGIRCGWAPRSDWSRRRGSG